MTARLRSINVEIWILLLAIFLTVPWLSLREFQTRGEPREAIVAQDMLRSGNWILPSGYGTAVPSKPPLLHWMIASASVPIGGVTEFTSRLPSALASVIFLYFFVRFIRQRTNPAHALLTGLILVTSVEFMRSASGARVDMLLAALQCGALLALFQWNESKQQGFPVAAILLMAGSVLTKGPVGVVLPTAILGLSMLLNAQSVLRSARSALLVSIPALVIAGIWYWLAYKQGGEALWQKFYYENIARFSGTMEDEPHKHSAFNLYLMAWVGLLPWSLFLLAPVTIGLRSFRETWKNLCQRFSLRWLKSLSPWTQWSLLSCLVFIIFFSIPTSKRSVYLLPIFPFLAEGIAYVVSSITDRQKVIWDYLLKVVSILAALVLILLTVGSNLSNQQLLNFPIDLQSTILSLESLPLWQVVGGFVCVVAMFLITWRWRNIPAFFATLILLLNVTILPIVGNGLSEEKLVREFSISTSNPTELYSFDFSFYGTAFYANRRIFQLESSTAQDGQVVLVFERSLEELNSLLNKQNLRADIISTSSPGVVKVGQRVLMTMIKSNDLPSVK